MSATSNLTPPAVGTRGPLAGMTILRFAHAFESGGGTERYLDDLDRTLLERNTMTIVRLHLTRDPNRTAATEQRHGLGRLVCVPLQVLPGPVSHDLREDRSLRQRFKSKAREWVLYNPLVWRLVGARWTRRLRLDPRPGQAIDAGKAAARIFSSQEVDLVMLHFFGGCDANEVILAAQQAGVPIAVFNHYTNERFKHLAIRKHVMLADGVAGVNSLDVPAYIRSKYRNLSDGIDTEYFRRAHARPVKDLPSAPVILLPARVTRDKGQMDLVKAAAQLHRSGVTCVLVFAGRIDATEFVKELREEIARCGLAKFVRFLGNMEVEVLRDWYASSAIVALPSYSEGLGRVLLEAHAMETPVVAYSAGGVPDVIESGTDGFLVPIGDIDQLAAHLRVLLESPELLKLMGEKGRAATERRFSSIAFAERHEHFYREIAIQSRTGVIVGSSR